MDCSTLTFDATEILTDFNMVVGSIKLARAKLMKGGPNEILAIHRRFKGDHLAEWRECWCVPIRITQTDWQSSKHFAALVMYPQVH